MLTGGGGSDIIAGVLLPNSGDYDLRHYELVTILSPMLNQDEAAAAWNEIKTFIADRDGALTAEQTWGTRRLAYPIRKGNYNFLEGSYYLSTFTAANPFNRELENYLRLDERVLRALVMRCDGPLEDKPPPGPLTAPSRYIPPGRGRRNDGGGPMPEGAGGFGERRGGPPPGAPGGPGMPPGARLGAPPPGAGVAPGLPNAPAPPPAVTTPPSEPAAPVVETASAVPPEPAAQPAETAPAVSPEPAVPPPAETAPALTPEPAPPPAEDAPL